VFVVGAGAPQTSLQVLDELSLQAEPSAEYKRGVQQRIARANSMYGGRLFDLVPSGPEDNARDLRRAETLAVVGTNSGALLDHVHDEVHEEFRKFEVFTHGFLQEEVESVTAGYREAAGTLAGEIQAANAALAAERVRTRVLEYQARVCGVAHGRGERGPSPATGNLVGEGGARAGSASARRVSSARQRESSQERSGQAPRGGSRAVPSSRRTGSQRGSSLAESDQTTRSRKPLGGAPQGNRRSSRATGGVG